MSSLPTISEWLQAAQARLTTAGIATARLDCLVLLEDATGIDRAQILAHDDSTLQIEIVEMLNKKIAQRAHHEPLAYIRGTTEFYGRDFTLNHHVLEPRPESETMIGLLKTYMPGQLRHPAGLHEDCPSTIVDVGTGSGALAITAKLEVPDSTVLGIDIDEQCLAVARKNARQHHVGIEFLCGDLLQPLSQRSALSAQLALLANLPYVPDNFQINPAAMREPRLAIFGGPDGLDLYRRLFAQAAALPRKPRYILTESMPPQHKPLADIAQAAGYSPETDEDFIQVFVPQR